MQQVSIYLFVSIPIVDELVDVVPSQQVAQGLN